jgi:5'-3' exonuclease
MLRGLRLGIDSDNFLHIQWSNALAEVIKGVDLLEIRDVNQKQVYSVFLSKILIYTRMLCNMEITPMFIFDGKGKSHMKKDTQNERRERIAKGRTEYEKYLDRLLNNPLEVNESTIKTLRSKYTQGSSMPQDHRKNSVEFIKHLGFPYADATGDGEQLAARLCNEGRVDAVLSMDTDCLCFGAPAVVNKLGGKGANRMATVLFLDNVLASLKLNYSEYIDLCIMAGNDYNDNVPQLAIGRSYDLIAKYRTLDNLIIPDKYKKNIPDEFRGDDGKNIYKFEAVREIFKVDASEKSTEHIELNGSGEIGQYVLDVCLENELIDHIPYVRAFLPRRMLYSEDRTNTLLKLKDVDITSTSVMAASSPSKDKVDVDKVNDLTDKMKDVTVKETENKTATSTAAVDNIVASGVRLKRRNLKLPS